MPRYSYDPACETLAEHFLGSARAKLVADLAQHIQNEVEDWINDQAEERARALGVPAPIEAIEKHEG